MHVSRPKKDPLVKDDPSGGVSADCVTRMAPQIRLNPDDKGSPTIARETWAGLVALYEQKPLPAAWDPSEAIERGYAIRFGQGYELTQRGKEGVEARLRLHASLDAQEKRVSGF